MVLKHVLYGLKTPYNSFDNFFGDFLIYLGFTTSREDQEFWLNKQDDYDEYDYISTDVDGIIIAEKYPSNYMNNIEQHFQVHDITYSPD